MKTVSSLPDSSSSSTRGVGSGFSCSGWTWNRKVKEEETEPGSPEDGLSQENTFTGKESRGSIRRRVKIERVGKQMKPAMYGFPGCALSHSSSPPQSQLRCTVNRGLGITEASRRNSVDNARYLIDTRVKELKGGMPGRAERAFLDEL